MLWVWWARYKMCLVDLPSEAAAERLVHDDLDLITFAHKTKNSRNNTHRLPEASTASLATCESRDTLGDI